MTYEDKIAAVIGGLDSDGADSEEEWAINILSRIGITKENPYGTPSIPPRVIGGNPLPKIPWDSEFICPVCHNDNASRIKTILIAETAFGISFQVECFNCNAKWKTDAMKTNLF